MTVDVGRPGPAERARLAAAVGALLVRERAARGWSQAEVRRRSGVNCGPIERGRQRPSWRALCRLAAAFQPEDARAARALADRLADAAGSSLVRDPAVPAGVAREVAVEALVRAAGELGFDLYDGRVRAVVVRHLRQVAAGRPGAAGAAWDVPAVGDRPWQS